MHLWYSLFCMILIASCSMVINGADPIRAIFSMRLLYRFYLFYLAIIILDLTDEDLKIINTFVVLLFLFQLPVVAVKFFIYGINERTMGAYATSDGSLNTTIPITIIFYAASYYLLYRPKFRYISTVIAFITVSVVGAKRAIFYFFPLQFFSIYYYVYLKGKQVRLSKKIATFFCLLFLISFASGVILFLNKSMNPQGEVGGDIDVGYALSYSQQYLTGVDGYGYTFGRTATTLRVFEVLSDAGLSRLFFGLGPGFITKSIFDSDKDKKQFQEHRKQLKILYGWTSMSKIAIEYGILGVFAYLLIIFQFAGMCWKYYRTEVDPYWRSFAAGSVGFAFAMIFFFFTYHDTAVWGDTLPALYFYAMGVVYTRSNRLNASMAESQYQPYNYPYVPEKA